MDEICIHGLALRCIVGIHPHERITEQPLRLDLTLGLDTREAARTGKISRTIHYGEVAEQVSALLRFRRYRLLEGAAEEVAWMLLGIYVRLEWLRIRVEKPRALEGVAEAASLTIVRTRDDLAQAEHASPHATTAPNVMASAATSHVVTREAELAIMQLEPNQELPLNLGGQRRLLLVLGGAVEVDGEVVPMGKHVWEDAGTRWRSVKAARESSRVFFCHTGQDRS